MDAGADAVEAGLMQYTDGAVVGARRLVEEGGQRLNIRHVQPIVNPEQIGKIPVVERDGKVIRMADLGQVVSNPFFGGYYIYSFRRIARARARPATGRTRCCRS